MIFSFNICQNINFLFFLMILVDKENNNINLIIFPYNKLNIMLGIELLLEPI